MSEFPEFPLYDILLNKISTNSDVDLTTDQKLKTITTIRSLDQINQANMFTIIKIFYLKNNNESNILDIPYQGNKVGEKRFVFNLENFPYKLKHMIYHFCKISQQL